MIAPILVVASVAAARADTNLGELVMDGHDAGHIMYADRCANGGSSDDDGRMRFIAELRGDPKSKLSRTIAEAEAKFVPDKDWFEVALGDWEQTYHLRDGCGDDTNSFSAFVVVRSKMGNSHQLWTKYVVTIDDDVHSDRREMRVRSIVPVTMRQR
jgi:hypothetical protein